MSILNLMHAFIVAKRTESFSPAQVRHLQQKRFRKLLRYVIRKSTFYRRYYHEHGITQSDVEDVNPEDLPLIDKQIMMENYDELVCDPLLKKSELERFISSSPDAGTNYKGVYKVIHTSGSSGTIGLFVFGPQDWMVAKVIGFRVGGLSTIPRKRSRLAFIGATDGHYASITSLRNAPSLLFKVLPLSINSPLEEIRRAIRDFQPDSLIGYASGVDLLAQEQLAGNINISPKKVWCMGEPLTVATRLSVRQAFAIDPLNLYGTSETLSLAMDCNTHHRLHLFDDWFSAQVIDHNLKPVKPGQPGRVVLTNLYNYTQPLIRYQMDDELVLSNEPCPCGWPFVVIDKIAGRTEESLWFTRVDGTREFIHPSSLGEFFVPGLKRFQFVQRDNRGLIMKVVTKDNVAKVTSAIHRRMGEIFTQKALDDSVQFSIEFVDHIPHDEKTGKLRLIIPHNDASHPC